MMRTTVTGPDPRTVLLPLPPAPPAPPAGFVPPMSGAAHHAAHHAMPLPVAAPAPRPPMRWGWLAIGVVAAVLAVAGLVSVAAAHRTMTVTGTATLAMTGATTVGATCTQTVAMGMPVSVYDASGTLVGTASLTGSGVARTTWGGYGWSSYGWSTYADSCAYSFSVPGVSTASSHYRVKLGGAPGDGVGFTLDQLRSGSADVTWR